MLIHRSQRNDIVDLAKKAVEQVKVGDPLDPATSMGPLVSKAQFNKVQGLIERGMQEGATLVCGGAGRLAGFNRGYFVQPTIFAHVTSEMTIAKEEIFGPVLSIHELRQRRRGGRDRQRHALWPRRLRSRRRPCARMMVSTRVRSGWF
jgi:aldehyde dehydrogenase (NAD+)